MNKPAKLVYSDKASFTLARGDVLVFLVIIVFVFGIALTSTDATILDLAVPCAALSSLWFFWIGLLGIVAWIHRIGEKRAINRMFTGEIWECWQFNTAEWQALVIAECNLISPIDEGLKPYLGAVYSSIFGIIIATIMVAVGIFAIEDPVVKDAMWIGAVSVFLLLLGIGLFQPLMTRYHAFRYHRKALQLSEPHVWFGELRRSLRLHDYPV